LGGNDLTKPLSRLGGISIGTPPLTPAKVTSIPDQHCVDQEARTSSWSHYVKQ